MPNAKRVTLKQIAIAASCSITAVSKVINQAKGGAGVGPELRDRILDQAKRLGYQVNYHAVALQSGRSQVVGFFLDPKNGSGYFWRPMLDAAHTEALQHGYQLLVVGSLDRGEELWRQGRIDVLIAPRGLLDAKQWRGRTCAAPLIPLDFQHHAGQPACLIADLEQACHDAVGHLAERRHRELLYLFPRFGRKREDANRVGHLRQAAKQHGLGFEEQAVPYPSWNPENTPLSQGDGAGCATAVTERLQANRCPSALVLFCEAMALGAVTAIQQAGRRLPDDHALITFDNVLAPLTYPRLSVVDVGLEAMGIAAVRWVLDLAEGSQLKQSRTVQGRFVPGETS